MRTAEDILKEAGYSEKEIKKYHTKLKRDTNKFFKESILQTAKDYNLKK